MNEGFVSVICRVREAEVEVLEQCLETAGVLAITCRAAEPTNAVFDRLDGEQRLWPICEVTGLFETSADLSHLESLFSAASIVPLGLRVESLAPRAWAESWREHFRAHRFGECLCVCPSWQKSPWPNDIQIELDPGMAFGTGGHATTALCLEWLAGAQCVAGARVLDYGCGSGILAIAAAKLGATSVSAVDVDSDALSVCAKNAALNGAGTITTSKPSAIDARQFEIVLANILLEPLLQLVRRFEQLLAPGGVLVLSGILDSQQDELAAAYAEAFTITHRQQSGEWALLVAAKND